MPDPTTATVDKLSQLVMADTPSAETAAPGKQDVNPWSVSGEMGADGKKKAINYNALIEEFGTKRIDAALLERFEKVTGHKPHRFLRRGIVFSHRDLDQILDLHEKGEPYFLYTGRGPSSDSMHVGHAGPIDFTKWLQEVLDVPLVIMMTDDEKFLMSDKRTIQEVKSYTASNAKDLIAAGFDPKKTFIFSDFDYMRGAWYENVVAMAHCITNNVVKAAFGFDGSDNIGKNVFPAIQGSTAFASSFPHIFGYDEKRTKAIRCLIPCAIDQDPYFRITRDVAPRMGCTKPALIHSRFLDALQGPGSKMSASDDNSAIFLNDTPAQIKKKINSYAFSGGQETLELQRELGGDPEVDVSFQYLKFFLDNDEELETIRLTYLKGELLTGDLKKRCIEVLQTYVKAFQERRAAVSDEVVEDFFSEKELQWKGKPDTTETPELVAARRALIEARQLVKSIEKREAVAQKKTQAAPVGGEVEGELTKNQLKKLAKEKLIAEKKAQKAAGKAA